MNLSKTAHTYFAQEDEELVLTMKLIFCFFGDSFVRV